MLIGKQSKTNDRVDDMMDEYTEIFGNANYQSWREIHTKAFGDIFVSAFEGNPEAQVHLTAALIHISNRRFEEAMPKLDFLDVIAECDFDKIAITYFKGLNYEFMGNEEEMTAYYGKVLASDIPLRVPFAFHPYYRTAKFAQRDSECSKAIHYYRKALAFYDGIVPDPKAAQNAGQIIYDVATVYLYMHRYDECERFLQWSKTYAPDKNEQRDFVAAILCAVQGKAEESQRLLKGMHTFYKRNCEPKVKAILAGADPHYCVVPQDRCAYGYFWTSVAARAEDMKALLKNDDADAAENIMSELLTETLPFMKRRLTCRMDMAEGCVTVYCKDYCVKTLAAEYDALFSIKPTELKAWNYICIHEFEVFKI